MTYFRTRLLREKTYKVLIMKFLIVIMAREVVRPNRPLSRMLRAAHLAR